MNQCLRTIQRIFSFPKILHNRSQKTKHTTSSLKLTVTTPTITEHIYQFWVERVRLLDFIGIFQLIAAFRQIGTTVVIHILISLSNQIHNLFVIDLIKQSSTNHLINFLIIDWFYTCTNSYNTIM